MMCMLIIKRKLINNINTTWKSPKIQCTHVRCQASTAIRTAQREKRGWFLGCPTKRMFHENGVFTNKYRYNTKKIKTCKIILLLGSLERAHQKKKMQFKWSLYVVRFPRHDNLKIEEITSKIAAKVVFLFMRKIMI